MSRLHSQQHCPRQWRTTRVPPLRHPLPWWRCQTCAPRENSLWKDAVMRCSYALVTIVLVALAVGAAAALAVRSTAAPARLPSALHAWMEGRAGKQGVRCVHTRDGQVSRSCRSHSPPRLVLPILLPPPICCVHVTVNVSVCRRMPQDPTKAGPLRRGG